MKIKFLTQTPTSALSSFPKNLEYDVTSGNMVRLLLLRGVVTASLVVIQGMEKMSPTKMQISWIISVNATEYRPGMEMWN